MIDRRQQLGSGGDRLPSGTSIHVHDLKLIATSDIFLRPRRRGIEEDLGSLPNRYRQKEATGLVEQRTHDRRRAHMVIHRSIPKLCTSYARVIQRCGRRGQRRVDRPPGAVALALPMAVGPGQPCSRPRNRRSSRAPSTMTSPSGRTKLSGVTMTSCSSAPTGPSLVIWARRRRPLFR